MKKFTFVLFVFCFIGMAFAQEKSVIERAKEKIKNIKTTETVKKTTAVAGVRGAEEKDEASLFWFGKDSVAKEELLMFEAALEKVEKGDKEGAKQAFHIFLNKYPYSVLAPDAYEIIKSMD